MLIDFWGTWCNPCIAMLPEIKAINDQYADKGLIVVGVAFDKKKEKVANFVEEKKLNWLHIFESNKEKNASSLVNLLNVESFPTTILLDRDGKILFRVGSQDFHLIKEKLNQVLNK
jgi:thiol-disulfide isomerase/thioredoxin